MISFFFCLGLQSGGLGFMQWQSRLAAGERKASGGWCYVVGMVSSRSRAPERMTVIVRVQTGQGLSMLFLPGQRISRQHPISQELLQGRPEKREDSTRRGLQL